MALCLRFFDAEKACLREEFVGFAECMSTSGKLPQEPSSSWSSHPSHRRESCIHSLQGALVESRHQYHRFDFILKVSELTDDNVEEIFTEFQLDLMVDNVTFARECRRWKSFKTLESALTPATENSYPNVRRSEWSFSTMRRHHGNGTHIDLEEVTAQSDTNMWMPIYGCGYVDADMWMRICGFRYVDADVDADMLMRIRTDGMLALPFST
ncbi:hypothetical protein DPMN_175610 [Dreissena polymorpha]|uniref:Uncharacterized protein n=1 Tax=Dreissena polymorpha TaxID=45954 RepID=A0A9D4E877_DREPO|nr:hypothetical protein DPMN_175610 [Dreissena polymorpha]